MNSNKDIKMKRIWTVAIAAIAILAAGCSNSEDDSVKPDMSGKSIAFTAGINDLATRAGRTTSNLTGSKFGLFLTTEGTNGDENYNATNKAVSENNGEWVQEPSLLWKSNTAKVSYTAYLPYTDQLENGKDYTINLSTTQTAETMLNEDLLFASDTSITAADNSGGIAVKFSHKLAKLKVVLTKGTEVDADMEVTGVKVPKCLIKGSMNVATGELTLGSSAVIGDYADVNLCGTKTEGSAFTDTWEALIMPTIWGGNEFTVTVTVGSGNDMRVFQYQGPSWMAYSGNEYTLSLQVGRDKIIAGKIRAREWTDAGASEIETD